MVIVGEGTRPNGPSHPCENGRKLSGQIAQLALMVQKYMATIKQIEANRLNALKSTGPKTPEGKAAVRMNALRHGLRARSVVLPGENSDDFHQLCDDLETEWNPKSRTEPFYVEQMAISQWKLTRIELAEKSIVTQEAAAKSRSRCSSGSGNRSAAWSAPMPRRSVSLSVCKSPGAL